MSESLSQDCSGTAKDPTPNMTRGVGVRVGPINFYLHGTVHGNSQTEKMFALVQGTRFPCSCQ